MKKKFICFNPICRRPFIFSHFLGLGHVSFCFNLAVDGSEIGMSPGETFYLGSGVIPMGWSSAVSIMQEIADRLTTIGRLPDDHKVRRDCPLPPWLVDTLSKSNANGASWFHVYLDNFCSMEKTVEKRVYQEAGWLHSLIEKSWDSSGVLSSSSKRVVSAGRAVELGAEVNGIDGSLGPTSERLLKLLQSTLSIIRKCKLNRKWVLSSGRTLGPYSRLSKTRDGYLWCALEIYFKKS